MSPARIGFERRSDVLLADKTASRGPSNFRATAREYAEGESQSPAAKK